MVTPVKSGYEPIRVDRTLPSANATFKTPWVPYPAGIDVLKAMASLIGRENEGRPQGLALIGQPNFGKSHLLDHFVDSYPDIEEGFPRIQVLCAETPAKADGGALLRELLRNMGATFNVRSPLDELMDKFCVRAQSLRVLMIVIDEFTNGHWGRHDAAMSLVHTLRSISNRLGRPIVIAGTDKLNDVLRNDDQLSERFRRMRLPEWNDTQAVADLLTSFEATFDMPEPSNLGTAGIANKVSELGQRKLGRITVMLREAHRIAQKAGARRVELSHIEAAALEQVGLPG